jgi:hypothetical protein
MEKKLLFSFFLVCSTLGTFAQTNNAASWTQNPYEREVYIENNGQYNDIIKDAGVLFSVPLGRSDAYFTTHGVTYRYLEMGPIEKGKDPDQSGPPKKTYHTAGAEWVAANPNVTLDAQNQQGWYCTYDMGNNQTVKAWPYKKMTYHNIYIGIDAEYSFHKKEPGENEVGTEYALIVHPGADLSQVKIKYTGVTNCSIRKNGSVIWTSDLGEITDHAPIAYYQGEEGNLIPVSYKINGDEETFSVPAYDKTKTLIIDPWTTSPAFTTLNTAYVLDYDYAGNVYVYGGVGYELVKFNNLGVKQWMYTATTLASTGAYIGGMCTDRQSQRTYLSEGWNASAGGARSEKIKNNGTLMATNAGNANMNEMWRLRWDPCNHFVWGVGNGTCCADQAAQIDTNMVTMTVANICAPTVASGGYHDFGSLDIDPAGTFIYTICSQSLISATIFNNYMVKCPIPGMVPAALQVPDHFAIHEFSSYTFGGNITNGFSGVGVGPNWLYLYNGDTVKKLNKATGAIVAVKNVATTSYQWGGTVADYCDNVYIGNNSTVQEYNSALALVNSYAMTSVIYDVKVNTASSLLYACGAGFTSAVTNTPPVCVHPAPCSVVLPVELLNFDCQTGSGTITLKWTTVSESDNKFFTIEHSDDGTNFVPIATIPGAGNSNIPKYYSYTDESPLNGINYYRLSQTDLDGNTIEYNTTSCNITVQVVGSIYPNPSKGKFSVLIDNSVSEIAIYNALGQRIFDKSMMENSGNIYDVDISSQPGGIYTLKLIRLITGKTIVKKLVVYPQK